MLLALLVVWARAVLGPPSSVTASPVSGGANVSWSAVSSATGYNVYRATTDTVASYAKVNTSAVTTTTYADSGLTNGTTYYYRVTTLDATGESARSNAAWWCQVWFLRRQQV